MIEHPFNVRVCAHLWEATKDENRRGHDPDHRNRFHQAIADWQLQEDYEMLEYFVNDFLSEGHNEAANDELRLFLSNFKSYMRPAAQGEES